MKSDLKKHKLLKILSIQRKDTKKPLGLSYKEICGTLKINRAELDKLCGELFGNGEIGEFNDGINPKGLHTNKIGYSEYSSEKYKRRHFKGIWTLIKNWSIVITLLITILIQFRYCQPNKSEDKTQEAQKQNIEDIEKKQSEKGQSQELEQYSDIGKDSTDKNLNDGKN